MSPLQCGTTPNLEWCVCEGVREAPFIVLIGWFPPSTNMETWCTALEWIGPSFPPKMRPDGADMGPADPVVRPAHRCRLSRRLSSWTLLSGPPTCVCQCRGFVHQFSLSNEPILKVKRGMGSSVCFCCVSCLFSPYSEYGCLQTKNHQNLWN